MQKRAKKRLALSALLILIAVPAALSALVYWQQRVASVDRLAGDYWLVAGPFRGNGENALFKDYLSGSGEDLRQAREGDIAAWGIRGVTRWHAASPSEDGLIDFNKLWTASFDSVAYAYTEINSDKDRRVVATVGSGADLQIRLNEEIVYESRVFRWSQNDKDVVVLPLRKGINSVLVKAQRGLAWKFQWSITDEPGSLFVHEKQIVIPDFRVTEQVAAWGQVEVANAAGNPLTGVAVEVLEDDLLSPTRSESVALAPDEVRRIPIWVASKKAVEEGSAPKVRLRVTAGQDERIFEAAPRVRQTTTSFVTTYKSALDGSVQPYSVLLPPSFDKEAAYPLILLLHGAHVEYWGRNIISYAPKGYAIQVAVHDRGNNYYRDVGEVDIDEVLLEVSKRYRVDPDRLYLSGHSMGGYGAWFLATHYPDRWAAISPQTAYSDLALETNDSADRSEFHKQMIVSRSPITFAENLLHVPAYMMHGAMDGTLSVNHSRKMDLRLKELGYEHVYDENPEGIHWWGERPEHEGVLCVDKPEISQFFQKHDRRVKSPRLVIYKTDSLRYRSAYWVAVDEMDADNKMATIRAEVVGPNNIAVQTENVAQFTLKLNEPLVARDQPLTVSVNGDVVFAGRLPGSPRLTLRRGIAGSYSHVADESSPALASGEGGAVRKTAQLYGPVADAFNRPFLLVVGTGGDGERASLMNEASRRAALSFVRDWMARANGAATIKADSEVTADDMASFNLVLFGNAATNSIISRINDALPLRFAERGIVSGDRAINNSDAGFVMINPNPLSRGRYVVIVGGTTPLSMEIASRLRLQDMPDYVVFDGDALAGRQVEFVEAGFFDKRWQIAR